MLKYRNMTTKEQFKSYYLDWAGERIHSVPSRFFAQRSWEIADNFRNVWTVTFTGEVGEFTVEGTAASGAPFKVWLYLSGDSVEIVKAYDGRQNIRSDVLLRKYKELACMVSNYFRFGLLRD